MAGYRKISELSALVDSYDLFLIDQFEVLHDGMISHARIWLLTNQSIR